MRDFTPFGCVSLRSQVRRIETHKKTCKEYLKIVQNDKMTIDIGIMGFLPKETLLLNQHCGVLTKRKYASNLKLVTIKEKYKKGTISFGLKLRFCSWKHFQF